MYNLILSYILTYNLGSNVSESNCLHSSNMKEVKYKDIDNFTGNWYSLCPLNSQDKFTHINNHYILRPIDKNDSELAQMECRQFYNAQLFSHKLYLKDVPGFYYLLGRYGTYIRSLSCALTIPYKIEMFKQYAVLSQLNADFKYQPILIKAPPKETGCYINSYKDEKDVKFKKHEIYSICRNNKVREKINQKKCLKLIPGTGEAVSSNKRLYGDWYVLKRANTEKVTKSEALKIRFADHVKRSQYCGTDNMFMDEMIGSITVQNTSAVCLIGKYYFMYHLIFLLYENQLLVQCATGPSIKLIKYNGRFYTMSMVLSQNVEVLVMIKLSTKLKESCVKIENSRDLHRVYNFASIKDRFPDVMFDY